MKSAANTLTTEKVDERGFRMELRDRTHDDHARLDALISGFDVADRAGLTRFMLLNAAGFQTLAPFALPGTLDTLVKALLADLRLLAGQTAQIPTLSFAPADSLAVAYIIAGSRLGTQVLARRWRASQDDSVLAASNYFTQPHDSRHWQEVCRQLDAVPPGSDRAERIVADTLRIYGLFEEACRLIDAQAAQHQTKRFT